MVFAMKRIFLFIIALSLLIFSCASNDVSEEIIEEPEDEIVIEMPEETVIEEEPAFQLFIDEEPDIVSVEEEPDPVTEYFSDTARQEEYIRSTSNLADDDLVIVPPEVFEEDKDQIFYIIDNLANIMKKKDAQAWIAYLCPESYEYWSNRHNLLELSRNLYATDSPRINNIKEYFELFFIPARRGRVVDEIRYVTPDYVKVVQYKNNTDIIYYFFEKVDGEWKLWLDTL